MAGQEAAASFDDTARAELLDYIILKPYVLDAFKVCVGERGGRRGVRGEREREEESE